jgi:hypothetical protein
LKKTDAYAKGLTTALLPAENAIAVIISGIALAAFRSIIVEAREKCVIIRRVGARYGSSKERRVCLWGSVGNSRQDVESGDDGRQIHLDQKFWHLFLGSRLKRVVLVWQVA